MPLLQTDMQSLLIKDLRLQRQRAQRPAQLCSPQTTKILQKEGRESTTASCGSRRKLNIRVREGERELKDFGKKEAEGSCKVTWKEKEI